VLRIGVPPRSARIDTSTRDTHRERDPVALAPRPRPQPEIVAPPRAPTALGTREWGSPRGLPDVENRLGVSATCDPSPTRGRHAPQRDATRCNAQGRSGGSGSALEGPGNSPRARGVPRGGGEVPSVTEAERATGRSRARARAQPANPYRRKNALPRARHSRVRACAPQSSRRLACSRGSSRVDGALALGNLKRAIVAPSNRLEICRRARSVRVRARARD